MRCVSPSLRFPQKDAPLPEQAVDPVLRCAPGDAGRQLDISDGEKTIVEGELPHEAQELATAFKHGGHNGR
jgi:hypothetical protein